MSQIINWIAGNLQYLVFIAIFGVSFLNWLFRKIKEQAEIKKIQDERARMRAEALRTGRAVEPAQEVDEGPSEEDLERQRRAEELERRRREQLQELRAQRAAHMQRVAAQRQQAKQGTSKRVPTSSVQPSVRSNPNQPTTPPTRTPAPTSKLQGRPPRQSQISTPEPRPLRDARALTSRVEPQRPAGRIAPLATRADPASGSGPIISKPMSRSELRRAIVLSEILAPPVSMRKPE